MNTINPVSKNIKDNLSMHGNATLAKIHYRRHGIIFTNTILNTNYVHQVSHLPLHDTEETTPKILPG
jgi:hypothetical protein